MSDEPNPDDPGPNEPSPADPSDGDPSDGEAGSGPLLDFERGEALEALDRRHAGPGGEPPCPACQTQMLRAVEQHRGPKSDESPFRVRLVCPSAECGAWTTYNW